MSEDRDIHDKKGLVRENHASKLLSWARSMVKIFPQLATYIDQHQKMWGLRTDFLGRLNFAQSVGEYNRGGTDTAVSQSPMRGGPPRGPPNAFAFYGPPPNGPALPPSPHSRSEDKAGMPRPYGGQMPRGENAPGQMYPDYVTSANYGHPSRTQI